MFQIPRQYKSYGKYSPTSTNANCSNDFMDLIEELIACDEFEDIATLKVRIAKEFL